MYIVHRDREIESDRERTTEQPRVYRWKLCALLHVRCCTVALAGTPYGHESVTRATLPDLAWLWASCLALKEAIGICAESDGRGSDKLWRGPRLPASQELR